MVGLTTLTLILIAVVPGSAYFVDESYTASVGVYSDAALTVPVADGQVFSYSLVKQQKQVDQIGGVWTQTSADETVADSFTASAAAPYTGTVSVSYWDGMVPAAERYFVYQGENWWVEGQGTVGGILHKNIYRYVIRDDAVPDGYVAASPDGVILTFEDWASPELEYQAPIAAGEEYLGHARSYNQRGATTLGEGEYTVLDLVCGFTQSLTVSVDYPNGVLNDVTYAYESGDHVIQFVKYGASQQNMILTNPTGKIHVQAMKWAGDDNNAKEIRMKVTDWMGNVVYEESSSANLMDVSLTLNGCSAEEFAAWMATHGSE
jgi:hypothetical protein